MKYFIASLTLTIGLMSSHNSLLASDTNIYIENHYGATIKFKKGAPNSNAPEVSVPNQERSLVGPYTESTKISIRTTGKGSRFVSYFTELTKQIIDISLNRSSNKNKDAIITIKPSRSYENWDIDIHWETKNQKIENLSEILDLENELANIIGGSLGKDYAEKARAIDGYDYTKATQRGEPNLRRSLLSKINEMVSPNRKPGAIVITPDLSTTEDLVIKDYIDMFYKVLQQYKVKDNR